MRAAFAGTWKSPAGTSIVGFADDALVVCAADDVRILELNGRVATDGSSERTDDGRVVRDFNGTNHP